MASAKPCDFPGYHREWGARCTARATRRVTVGIMAGSWKLCEAHVARVVEFGVEALGVGGSIYVDNLETGAPIAKVEVKAYGQK